MGRAYSTPPSQVLELVTGQDYRLEQQYEYLGDVG